MRVATNNLNRPCVRSIYIRCYFVDFPVLCAVNFNIQIGRFYLFHFFLVIIFSCMMSSPPPQIPSRIESRRCYGHSNVDKRRQFQRKSNKQINKIRQFIESKSQTNESIVQTMKLDRNDENTISGLQNLSANDSFSNKERKEYEKLIAELRAALAMERKEHNIFLKEMAELLAEMANHSEHDEQSDVGENINLITIESAII